MYSLHPFITILLRVSLHYVVSAVPFPDHQVNAEVSRNVKKKRDLCRQDDIYIHKNSVGG